MNNGPYGGPVQGGRPQYGNNAAPVQNEVPQMPQDDAPAYEPVDGIDDDIPF